MLIDSHAHLEGDRFGEDLDAVLRRAREAGVDTILAIGTGEGPGSLDCAIKVAEGHDWIYASVGIHPHDAKLASAAAYAELEQLSPHPKVIAWGEIGLDYFYDHSPEDVQKQVFRKQMEMAQAAGLPIVIHCRNADNSTRAWDDMIAMLREHWAPNGLGGIMHCFSGTVEHMHAAVEIGFHISFSGNVTFAKAQTIRDAALACPLDRMLVETDSPFLAPVPHRGKRNEPAFVAKTAGYIAQLREIPFEELAGATSNNFRRLFERHLNTSKSVRQTQRIG
jgi:TatD DNase family protein